MRIWLSCRRLPGAVFRTLPDRRRRLPPVDAAAGRNTQARGRCHIALPGQRAFSAGRPSARCPAGYFEFRVHLVWVRMSLCAAAAAGGWPATSENGCRSRSGEQYGPDGLALGDGVMAAQAPKGGSSLKRNLPEKLRATANHTLLVRKSPYRCWWESRFSAYSAWRVSAPMPSVNATSRC